MREVQELMAMAMPMPMPIVILNSGAGDEHRQIAPEAGVDVELTNPDWMLVCGRR